MPLPILSLQVDVPYINHAQTDVHGLLGQLSVSVGTPGLQSNSGSRSVGHGEGVVSTAAGTNCTGPTAGSCAPGSGLADEAIDAEPATLRVSVGAQGNHSRHQGEGVISGHYSEYMVASLAEHQGFRFSRFSCAQR